MKTVVARGDNDCFVLLWYFTTVDSLVFLPKYSIIIKFKLHNSGFGLSASAAYSPIDWVRLCSVAEINRTQSNGLSTIRFDFGVRFRSIAELNRTQSTDWVRLSSISERSICYPGTKVNGLTTFSRSPRRNAEMSWSQNRRFGTWCIKFALCCRELSLKYLWFVSTIPSKLTKWHLEKRLQNTRSRLRAIERLLP